MSSAQDELLRHLPEIPQDEDGPIFNEPWQAQIFGMVVHLHENGIFTWGEWVEIFSQELANSDGPPQYYFCWLRALEKIICEKGALAGDEIVLRKKEWAKAAARTPHGQAIEL